MTDREVGASMVLHHINQQCVINKSLSISIKSATSSSMLGPLSTADSKYIQSAINAALDHKLLTMNAGLISVAAFGQVFLAFTVLASGDPKHFEEHTENHALLNAILESIAKESRFDPPELSASNKISTQPRQPTTSTTKSTPGILNIWTILIAIVLFFGMLKLLGQ